jgi:hypothetical protein
MRQITRNSVVALIGGYSFNSGNTQVRDNALYLHGNKIAELRNGELWITTAGWKTNTTKERLNGFPNVTLRQKDYVWYLNGSMWDGRWIKVER